LLIFGSAFDADVVEEARRLRLPFVAIDDVAHDVLVPTVVTDSRAGARLGVEHLLSLGRRKIAYVGSDYDAYYVRERRLGYRDTLANAGISFDPALIVTCPDTLDESLRVHPNFDRFLASRPDIDAIFCEADQIAAAVLRSLRIAGLSVPTDISLVGFDDERAALLVDPPLTSVRQPYEELGRRAVDTLLSAIRGESVPVGRQLVPPRLVVRESTAVRDVRSLG
jgi:LacI family transcriptional regulator